MPRPLDPGRRYVGGLDGVRSCAVAAVIAYHLGVKSVPGGLLGVGVFFTLSGYLITDLLVGRWEARGDLALSDFWLRRARRLLPAVVVLLSVAVVWVNLKDPSQLGSLRGNVVAAAGYFSNWWLILQNTSYFDRFGPPSPLGHLWSLAVEEQFYLLWPWLLWLGLRWLRKRWAVTVLTLLGAAISAVAMAVLYHPGTDPTRVYDGTDTRAFGLLIGAALALVWPSRSGRSAIGRRAQLVLDGAGWMGALVVAVLIWRVGQYSAFLYRGGMVLLSVATAVVVAAVVHPATSIGRALAVRPLRWVGVRSYGIYLWHYPIIVLTTATASQGFDAYRATWQVGATVVAAAVSWRLVEEPIRRGTFWRGGLHSRTGRWHQRASRWSWAVSVVALWIVALCSVALLPGPPSNRAASASLIGSRDSNQARAAPAASRQVAPAPPAPSSGVLPSPTPAPTTTVATTSSCQAVVHIGDSTSESLDSADYLPNPADRIDAQYQRVGATTVKLDISGARSTIERYKDQPNASDVAQTLVDGGFHGCWVLAVGMNDAANIAVGADVGEADRIKRMMAVIGDQPVLWVNATTLLDSGPYASSNMARWNDALTQMCDKYPNLRVYDWASIAQPEWFTNDATHYTSTGSAIRAHLIADSLAKGFPATGPSSKCVVR